MGEHSATPWECTEGEVWIDTRVQVCCGRGYQECCGEPDIEGGQELVAQTSPVNAAYIVKCVNAHEGLVKALGDMLHLCQALGDFKNGVVHNGIDEGEVYASGIFDQARAALASLSEGKP